MIRKTLASLGCIALLGSLAACSGSPGDASSPPASQPAPEPSSEPSPTTPPESPEATDSSDAPESPSSEPQSSEDSEGIDEIPSVIHGKWITFSKGESPQECTQELDDGGAIITIDATTISSFAFLFELEELDASNDTSMEGSFTYQDDSDEPITPVIRLETDDDWQTLEFIELNTEGQAPAMYSRCS